MKLISSGGKKAVTSSLKICMRMLVFKKLNKLNDQYTEAEQEHD